jgi:rhodanese-related sulfurtransferase
MKTQSIQPHALAAMLANEGCQLVDVREPVEHAEIHVAGARLIPLGQLHSRQHELDAHRPVVLMCHAGKRGESAAATLSAAGFSNVQNLEGGMLAWQAAGLPSVVGERRGLPLMRQVQVVIGLCVLFGSLLAVLVDPRWVYLCMFFGAGLIFAGLSGFCGLAIMLSRMPWNRRQPRS